MVPLELTAKVSPAHTTAPARLPLLNWRTGALASRLSAISLDGPTAAAARLVGFVMLAGLGLAIIAGVVLLPAIARHHQAQYEQACLDAKNSDDESLILAYDRLAEGIATDPVLAKRLAMREFGYLPQGELVLPAAITTPMGDAPLITTEKHPAPPPPNARLLAAAANVSGPTTRTVLLLLAIALLVAAIALTSPRTSKRLTQSL